MIIFFHGLDSSVESSKFTVIQGNKIALPLHYREQGFDEISAFIDQAFADIRQQHPHEHSFIFVGHSMGGYWALNKGMKHGIPTVLINPQLFPSNPGIKEVSKYHVIDTKGDTPIFAYIELGDEVIDVPATLAFLQHRADMTAMAGGHHRIQKLENINKVVQKAMS